MFSVDFMQFISNLFKKQAVSPPPPKFIYFGYHCETKTERWWGYNTRSVIGYGYKEITALSNSPICQIVEEIEADIGKKECSECKIIIKNIFTR